MARLYPWVSSGVRDDDRVRVRVTASRPAGGTLATRRSPVELAAPPGLDGRLARLEIAASTWEVVMSGSVIVAGARTPIGKLAGALAGFSAMELGGFAIAAALERAGIRPDQVDYVFCTHLHIDHTGWNTTLRDGRWVPTFPNAKYIFHKQEYAVWEAENAKGANPPGTVFRDNCLPIVEAGQALLVDDDYALDDTITLTPTPGHSPCHCCVNIFSRGQRAVVTGDLMHHVIQCREPDWSAKPDWDAKQSAISRRKFFASVAGTDTLILPIHFPTPTVGSVTADADLFNYRFKRD